jgi:thioredoxin reductase (NADPH)
VSQIRDLIIVGGGPAGYTAAIYGARAELKPLVFEGEPLANYDLPGGQLRNTTEVENYPGFKDGVMGPELIDAMRAQAENCGAEILTRMVTKVDLSVRPFRLWVGKEEYRARSLVIATGAKARMLGLPGIWDRVGHGVSTCATCDGFFFRGHDIAVVGGGDAAMEEATFLARFARSVTVIHRRDELRASVAMQERARANDKIVWRFNAEVTELLGADKLAGVRLGDTVTGEVNDLAVTGLFVAIGHDPRSDIVKGQIETDEAGYIVTDDRGRTSVPGVFAAGDVQDSRYRQAITSAGSGCIAAMEAEWFLRELA